MNSTYISIATIAFGIIDTVCVYYFVKKIRKEFNEKMNHMDFTITKSILESDPQIQEKVMKAYKEIRSDPPYDHKFAMKEARRLFGLEPLSQPPIRYKFKTWKMRSPGPLSLMKKKGKSPRKNLITGFGRR